MVIVCTIGVSVYVCEDAHVCYNAYSFDNSNSTLWLKFIQYLVCGFILVNKRTQMFFFSGIWMSKVI